MICKFCGAKIADNAKTCPHCGCRVSTPIYKRFWFWVIIGIIFLSSCNTIQLPRSRNEDALKPVSSGPVKKTPAASEEKADPVSDPEAEKETKTVQSETDKSVKETDQSAASVVSTPAPVSDPESAPFSSLTTSQKNALESAKTYLYHSSFSHDGLVHQLEYEKFSADDAVYAADNCGADWFEQALKSAKSYLNHSAFSFAGLVRQLEYEKFTNEQAVYAADNCGADWFEQAAKSARSYLSFSSFSRDELIGQLEYEGFMHDQAVYGADANGL